MGNFPVIDKSSYSSDFQLKNLRSTLNQDRPMLVGSQPQLFFNMIQGRTHFGDFFDKLVYCFWNSTHCELLFDNFYHNNVIKFYEI